MSPTINKVLGPRVAPEFKQEHPLKYRIPAWLLTGAAVLLLISVFLPYWQITMYAPQYPNGLTVVSYVNHLGGRVDEVNILNQYIGMRPLQDAAQFEKRIAVAAVVALALLLVAAVEVHSPWAALLSIPAALFPLGFLADLQYWLANFGLHLDPHAPLNMSVKPFIPRALGVGHIGQFSTQALPAAGLILSIIASGLIIAGLWRQRRIFKPLRDTGKSVRATASQAEKPSTSCGSCS
ncbi:MAG TPA: cytochrome C [Terriglobia bacterium]|nr:cytochrome C [Terriglobia bacterium]